MSELVTGEVILTRRERVLIIIIRFAFSFSLSCRKNRIRKKLIIKFLQTSHFSQVHKIDNKKLGKSLFGSYFYSRNNQHKVVGTLGQWNYSPITILYGVSWVKGQTAAVDRGRRGGSKKPLVDGSHVNKDP